MEIEHQQHLQELKEVYQKRLRVLEIQMANRGQDTLPHILIEIAERLSKN